MMDDYFSVGLSVERELHDKLGAEVGLICSPFTANDAKTLQRHEKSLHISPLPSAFGIYNGRGEKQAETQRWLVALMFKSPVSAAEEAKMRQEAGRLCLKLRRTLQGFQPDGGKPLRAIGNQFYMTEDCRFRIFSFTFESDCIV